MPPNMNHSPVTPEVNLTDIVLKSDDHAALYNEDSSKGFEKESKSSSVDPPVSKKALFAAMLGFFGDSYSLFSISAAGPYIQDEYGVTDGQLGLMSSLALWGAVIGQLTFGYLADRYGRRPLYLVTGVLIVLGTIGCTIAQNPSDFPVWAWLSLFRLITGVGVGGEYPLSATVAAESCSPKLRGKLMTLVFAMQPLGATIGAAIPLAMEAGGVGNDPIWRTTMALALVPIGISLYMRYAMEESEDFKRAKEIEDVALTRLSILSHAVEDNDVREVRRSHRLSIAPAQTKHEVEHWFHRFMVDFGALIATYGRDVAGTALAWFLFDIITIGNGLASSEVASGFGIKSDHAKAQFHLVFNAVGLPAGFLAAFTLDRWGRVNIMGYSFAALVVIFLVLGAAYSPLSASTPGTYAMAALYTITNLISFYGPGAMTYVIPGEYFPSAHKARLHGFSAASGKVGAAIFSYVFAVMDSQVVFILSCVVGLFGVIVTFALVPRYDADQITDIQEEKEAMFRREREARTITALKKQIPDFDANAYLQDNKAMDIQVA
eukprot:Clim_evm30s141 gene=Clim_evmTU30s141